MIFVAAPYYHFDKEVIQRRVAVVAKYCGKLLLDKKMCTAPIAFGNTVLNYCNLPDDFGFWDTLSFSYLKNADEMHVLMLDGWESSRGVREELNFAMENKIRIVYVGVAEHRNTVEFFESARTKKERALVNKILEIQGGKYKKSKTK